ncbi:hypothetical protein ABG953_05970 [Enterococcus faecalis]|uniref:hypothetical protein n=1 Tax=Enterococcus faecalis TaxID=1351 RepID=UPI00325B7DC3
MNLDEEKKIIYMMMREIIAERRELSKQYFDLKTKLDKLSESPEIIQNKHLGNPRGIQKVVSEKQIGSCNTARIPMKRRKNYPFERIAGYVVEILKDTEHAISSKELYEQLINKYDVPILYSNFSNNILPKINDSKNFSISKVGRGYWQYDVKRK